MTYELTQNALNNEYRGAGKAWAALVEGRVAALRYMDVPHTFATAPLPAWVAAISKHAEGLDDSNLPTAWSSKGFSALAAAASACADCPTKDNGGRYRPKDLLTMARAVLLGWRTARSDAWRDQCRGELAAIGPVVSGMCSATQFVAD